MREIKADFFPIIWEEWGQEKEGEEVHYLSPLPKRCYKWVKYQKELFQKDNPPVHNKEGNEVYILLVVLAYNILNWFKRFLLPEEFRSRCIKWIRMYLLNLSAIIQRKKKQYFIKFSKFYSYRELFEYVFRKIAKSKPCYVV